MLIRWIPERKLLLIRYEGTIDLERMRMYVRQAVTISEGKAEKLIVDHRTSYVDVPTKQMPMLMDYLKSLGIGPGEGNKRGAALVLDAHHTAFSLLFARSLEEGIAFKSFSTVPAACEFVGIDLKDLEGHYDVIPMHVEPPRR